ncbi:hypothetical protein LCM4573_04435 [Rhizobium sp. LCM 4573]|nr:hypothetical protein LCM4573_04435 [Rhizobium sp. LCM 4573]
MQDIPIEVADFFFMNIARSMRLRHIRFRDGAGDTALKVKTRGSECGQYYGHLIFYFLRLIVSPPDRAPLAARMSCDVGLDRLTGCLVSVEIRR